MEIDRLVIPDSDGDEVRTEIQQRKQHEFHLVGRERKVPGHILFSYNMVTGEIKQAEVQYCKDVDFVTRLPVHAPKTVIEPNCVYRQALNKKNFIRKLIKEGIISRCAE